MPSDSDRGSFDRASAEIEDLLYGLPAQGLIPGADERLRATLLDASQRTIRDAGMEHDHRGVSPATTTEALESPNRARARLLPRRGVPIWSAVAAGLLMGALGWLGGALTVGRAESPPSSMNRLVSASENGLAQAHPTLSVYMPMPTDPSRHASVERVDIRDWSVLPNR